MSNGDGTDDSTRVSIVRRAWAPMIMSYLTLNDLATRGSCLLGYLPDTGNPKLRLQLMQN
jgi:hypothetical protein